LVRTIVFEAFAFGRADGLADFTNFFILAFAALAPLAFVALRAGAFSDSERLTINVGRDDLPDNARLLPRDVAPLRREAGLDNDRLTPLTVGSLMRSSKLSKKVTHSGVSCRLNCAQLNTARDLNQRYSRVCGSGTQINSLFCSMVNKEKHLMSLKTLC
jgi:hypothetical protein